MSAIDDFVEHRRAVECGDCFDRFFAAWIAIVSEARRHITAQLLAQPDTDRIAILQYFETHADLILAVLAQLPEQTNWLARRQGTGTGMPILDVNPYSPEHLRRDFDELSAVWLGQREHKPPWVAGKTD